MTSSLVSSSHAAAPPSREFILRAAGAVLGYGRHVVLRDVSLEILPGERWFFVGANGSGKSTLLKAALGTQRPLVGSVTLAPELRSGQKIGFVPQRCDTRPTLPQTVREFVRLGLAKTGMSLAERKENVAWALEMTGIANLADRDYWAVSGGQRQRALIARGLARRPSLLILDEPTNGLDVAAEESLAQLVVALSRDLGLTVIFVTHVLALAMRHATHAALFHDGKVTCGRNRDVLVPDLLREAYGVDEQLFHRLKAASL